MKTYTMLVLLFCSHLSLAQDDPGTGMVTEFIKRHNAKMDTVSWLCQYDDIAWWTSDSVMATPKEEQAKLGREWFCFQQNDEWHAVYGKFAANRFETIYHYQVSNGPVIKRVHTAVDTFLLHSYSRALIKGHELVTAYPDSIKVRYNQYIRRNKDQTLSVWFLPAFTTNGIAVYGGEFYYLFDATGNHLLSKSEYSQGYKGLKPDRTKEVWLPYPNVEEPTLGSVFFAWYYRTYFDRIIVDARKIKSVLLHETDKGYYWIHAVK